jgi:hypothetical protein
MFLVRLPYYMLDVVSWGINVLTDVVGWVINVLTVVVFLFFLAY